MKDASAPEDPNAIVSFSEFSLMEAERLRKDWADIAKPLNSAQQLPDVTLQIDGQPVLCALVRIQSSDMKRPDPNYTVDKAVWIDRRRPHRVGLMACQARRMDEPSLGGR